MKQKQDPQHIKLRRKALAVFTAAFSGACTGVILMYLILTAGSLYASFKAYRLITVAILIYLGYRAAAMWKESLHSAISKRAALILLIVFTIIGAAAFLIILLYESF